MFVNTLTSDDKFSRRNMQIFRQQLQTPLYQKGKTFSRFSIQKKENPSLIITEIIASEKDVYLIAHHSVINVLAGSKICWSQHSITYFLIFPWIRDKLSWKMSALVTSEILRLLVNTLTADDKYSYRYMQIFWQQFRTPLSQKEKTFFGVFIAFPKCAWNLQHSEKKEEYPSVIITENITSERDVYLSV